MTAPFQRGRDPHTVSEGWEVAVVVIGGAALTVALAVLLGLGAASAVFGGGWVWPHGTTTIGGVLGGLFQGHPGRGFDHADAARVAGPTAVYLCVAVIEIALITSSVVAALLCARYRRPGDTRRGMATRHDANQVLGRSRLYAARSIIRPDLYPVPRRRDT